MKIVGEFAFDLANGGDVGEGALVVEATSHSQVLGVVGDGHIFVAAGESGLGHLADGVAAVGGDGVHVDVAANVGLGDEVGEAMRQGGLELAGVFAEFGGNPVHAEGGVDLFFGGSGDEGSV